MHLCANWRHHYAFHFIQNCAYQKPSKVNVSLGSSGPPMVLLGFMSTLQMHPRPRRFRFADSWRSRYFCLLFRSFNISCQFLLYQTWRSVDLRSFGPRSWGHAGLLGQINIGLTKVGSYIVECRSMRHWPSIHLAKSVKARTAWVVSPSQSR